VISGLDFSLSSGKWKMDGKWKNEKMENGNWKTENGRENGNIIEKGDTLIFKSEPARISCFTTPSRPSLTA
jgi:hypothetical protein